MKELKISKLDKKQTSDFGWLDCNYYKLNMTVLDAFRALGVQKWDDFWIKLSETGVEQPFMIVASEEDVEADKYIDSLFVDYDTFNGSEEDKKFYNEVSNFMLNFLLYKDIPYEENGKWGLKCTSGKQVIPPLFDDCKGAIEFDFHSVLCSVKIGNKKYLTPRDGSGKIVSDGYDSILRSCGYIWVEKDGKKGLFDSKTGEILVPCEMNWMAQGPGIGNWLIGKGDKIGVINGAYGKFDKTTFIYPEYDYVDLTTGQFSKNGELGWVRIDGGFVGTPPRLGKDFFYYIFPEYPLSNDMGRKYWDIKSHVKNKEVGIIKSKAINDNGRTPKSRLKLPVLEKGDLNVKVREDVRLCFEDLKSYATRGDNSVSTELIDPNGSTFEISINTDNRERMIHIIWKENDESKIAVDQAFPLLGVCHRFLSIEKGSPILTISLEINYDDWDLAMQFLSSLMDFRQICSTYNPEEWNGLLSKVVFDENGKPILDGYMTGEELKEKLEEDIREIEKMEEDEGRE